MKTKTIVYSLLSAIGVLAVSVACLELSSPYTVSDSINQDAPGKNVSGDYN